MTPRRQGYDDRVDDEPECPGHVWLLDEVEAGSPQTPQVFQCMNCGAVRSQSSSVRQDSDVGERF
jgi:hypothetical protein